MIHGPRRDAVRFIPALACSALILTVLLPASAQEPLPDGVTVTLRLEAEGPGARVGEVAVVGVQVWDRTDPSVGIDVTDTEALVEVQVPSGAHFRFGDVERRGRGSYVASVVVVGALVLLVVLVVVILTRRRRPPGPPPPPVPQQDMWWNAP